VAAQGDHLQEEAGEEVGRRRDLGHGKWAGSEGF
jgi:hypothetical protein